ncbi:uncharacterized protein LOC144382410 isoform X3 [Halichoerus grypus]
MKTQMETLALGSPGCRLTLQILGFACLCNSVSWELCSTPFHFGTQAGKAVTILNIAYHCIEYQYETIIRTPRQEANITAIPHKRRGSNPGERAP